MSATYEYRPKTPPTEFLVLDVVELPDGTEAFICLGNNGIVTVRNSSFFLRDTYGAGSELEQLLERLSDVYEVQR